MLASLTVKIKSYDDYNSNTYTDFLLCSKNPGIWGNGLKVFTIDHFADQVISWCQEQLEYYSWNGCNTGQ